MLEDVKKLAGARKIVNECLDTQPGEKVFVLTDLNKKRIGEIVAAAAYEVTDDVIMAVITPRELHGEDPPARIVPAMIESDIIIMPLSFSMTHAEATDKARKNGARVVSMGDFTESMLEEGGIEADFLDIKNTVEKIASIFNKGKKATVITSKGTKLEMDIEGRPGASEPGVSLKPGNICSTPNIEANVGPLEGTTEGIIVVDGSIPHPSLGVIKQPIKVTVENGEITKIHDTETNPQAKTFEKMLENMDDPNIYNIAELGIGLNPSSNICGSMLEDEGVAGTCHIGIGDNRSFEGNVKAKSHIDLVLRDATIKIDGKFIQENGELKLD
ncbi:MAG: aminopeptidase [Thermoplasmatota archaeon]